MASQESVVYEVSGTILNLKVQLRIRVTGLLITRVVLCLFLYLCM